MRIDKSYLRQTHIWPSESKGEDVPIYNMEPPHAYGAWRLLRREAQSEDRWISEVRLSPLATTLLRQALGELVVFVDTLPEVELDAQDELLARCYDALAELDVVQETHPVRRAQIVARHINPKETT